MLQSVEIVPTSARSSVRRSIEIGCELTTNAVGPRREIMVDLSPRGARVITDVPVERGQRVLIGFASEALGRRIESIARVAHVDREPLMKPSIGLEFVSLDQELEGELGTRLRGVPPPLPSKRALAPQQEMVWVDMLVTWEEDLGDRINVWELSERFAAIDEGDMIFETLAPFITGGAGAPRWLH